MARKGLQGPPAWLASPPQMKQIDPVISAYFAKIGSRGGKVMSEAKRKANQQRAKLPRKKAVQIIMNPEETFIIR